MRSRLFFLTCLVALFGAGAALPAHAQSIGETFFERCKANPESSNMCRALYATFRTDGGLCRDATEAVLGPDDGVHGAEECSFIDGVVIKESLVAAHEGSWITKALSLQRGLDDRYPMQDELWVHTHNSYNADAYAPTFYGLDRNNIYSVTDQLRMGARAIELDLHWAPSTTTGLENAVLVCHGEAVDDFEVAVVHFGCGVNDPVLDDYLTEIRTWLDRPKNAKEVLIVYLENKLDGEPAAHSAAAASLRAKLGDLIYRPATNCARMPFELSRKTILKTGKRVLVTGNCDVAGNAWGDFVHIRGLESELTGVPDVPRWIEAGLGHDDDYPAYPCTGPRSDDDYPQNWIRHWGDETGLSSGTGGGGDVTESDARNMARCGVNMLGIDNLVPFDKRLAATVWSWENNEPSVTKRGWCAERSATGRFVASKCKATIVKGKETFTKHRFACFNGTDWTVPAASSKWANGGKVCAAAGAKFVTPWNGYENERLKKANVDDAVLWLNYTVSKGAWVSK